MEKPKNLEEKIVDRIYSFEAKKTTAEVILRLVTLGVVVFGVYLLGSVIGEVLHQQQTFSIFDLWREDFDAAREYLGSMIMLVYYETPTELVLLFGGCFIALVALSLTFLRNFARIKNRIYSLVNHWFHY